MESLKLGQLIDGNAERDATHIAVAPVIVSEKLKPGARVGFTGTDQITVGKVKDFDTIGIIDPFLTKNVLEGERCWLFLYPQTITSLKHNWTHPAFEAPKTNVLTKSERWIISFAQTVGLSYDCLMGGAKEYLNSGEHLCYGGLLEGLSVPDEFWDHYQVVTGKIIKDKGNFFSCSC